MRDCKRCKWQNDCGYEDRMSCAHGQNLDGIGDYSPIDSNEKVVRINKNYLFDKAKKLG